MLVFLDLPGDLVREMKRKATHEGRRLSELAEECMRRGFEAPPPFSDTELEAEALALASLGTDGAPEPMSLEESLQGAKIR